MRIRLADVIGSSEAWGTEKGADVFSALNKLLLNVSQGTVISLSYKGLHRSDASFQREAVVELLRKYRPRLAFIVTDLRDKDVRANLDLALARYQQLLLSVGEAETEILGRQLNEELSKTWALVRRLGDTTTPQLAASLRLETATASSRLSTLWKSGLLTRIEAASRSGGREFVYSAIG